jgi:hypothetical protein
MEDSLRYANNGIPRPGDRIQNSRGDLGTVRTVFPGTGKHAEPTHMTVKWDEGIVEIEYESAVDFTPL